MTFKIEAAGFLIERDEAGAWWMTSPPELWGCETVDEMREVVGCEPERDDLNSACFACAPFMERIIEALCRQIEGQAA